MSDNGSSCTSDGASIPISFLGIGFSKILGLGASGCATVISVGSD